MAASAFVLAAPASAACDERAIARMSATEAAEAIWARADLIGYGYVSSTGRFGNERQSVDMMMSFKGPADVHLDLYAPPGAGDEMVRTGSSPHMLLARTHEVTFLMLSRTEQGYVPMRCGEALVARDRAAIIRLLAARGQREPSR